jgi:hypothetical protein
VAFSQDIAHKNRKEHEPYFDRLSTSIRHRRSYKKIAEKQRQLTAEVQSTSTGSVTSAKFAEQGIEKTCS